MPVIAACALCVTPARAGTWDGLWRTADQRAQAMQQSGDAAAAARTYTDPRHRAYAELQAGQYRVAAQHYAALSDPEAAYNRGNALARAGDLQQALAAYDAALKLDPGDPAARHNRDLVAKALQQDRPPPGPSGGAQQPEQPPPSPSPSSGASAAQSGARGTPASAPAGGAGAAPQPAARRASGAGADAHAAAAPPPGVDTSAARHDQKPGPPPPDGAGRAADRAALPGHPPDPAGPPGLTAPAAPTEQQLAEDQWLRSIPDDPGGLLRRKFLVQHLLRQQQLQQQQQAGPGS